MSPIRIDDGQFTHDGRPLRLRGVNYGNWMLIEHYMIGLPWTEYKMREAFLDILGPERYRAFFDTFMDASCAEGDFAFLQARGFNFVRLPLNYRWFEDAKRDRTCRAFAESAHDGFGLVDRFLGLAEQHGISVLLDLHAAPGVQVRDWNAESCYGEAFLWDHDHFIERTCDLWRQLARRYRGRDSVMGYDVLGEPLCDDHDRLNEFYRRVIEAIRGEDPEHIIAVEGDRWGQDAASLCDDLFADPQLTYSPHFYPTSKHPFHSLDDYPGTWHGKNYGREEMAALLQGYTDEDRIRRPVLMGEFGVPGGWPGEPGAPGAMRMLRDVVEHCETRGWSWAVWCYKDLGRLGLLRPAPATAWRRFVDSPQVGRWRDPFGECLPGFLRALADAGAGLSEPELRLLPHHWRHHWHATILPHVVELLTDRSADDLSEMARSFALDACEVHEAKLAALAGA